MSALRNPFSVMKTLIAATVTVLSAVLVNRDSLEMAQIVKVPKSVFKIISLRYYMNQFQIKTKQAVK